MTERLNYEDAVKIINENIDECLEYWNNEHTVKSDIRIAIMNTLGELKKCKSIYQIGNVAIAEYDSINSNEKLMGGVNNDMKERTLGVFWSQIYKIRMLVKSINIPTNEIVGNSFKDIIAIGKIGDGWRKVICRDDKYKDTPDIAYNHITNGGDGNSFIFSASLAKLLHEHGVKCQIVSTVNNKKNRYAVMYSEETTDNKKEKYIADPYAEISELAENNINSEQDREVEYIGKVKKLQGIAKDNSRLSMDQFLGENDFIWILGDPYASKNTKVDDLFKNIKIIARNHHRKETEIKDKSNIFDGVDNNEER